MAVINDSQIVGRNPSEIYSQITWYYNTQRGSVVHCPAAHITGRRRKGKGLEISYKYDYYGGPTKDPTLIQDPTIIFAIILFPPPLNETRQLYETGCNSR